MAGQHRASQVVEASRTRLAPVPLPMNLPVVTSVPDHAGPTTSGTAHPFRPAMLTHQGEAFGIVDQRADSDEGGQQCQSYRGHHSNLMAARPDHPRRSILLMSWSGNQGQAEVRSLRRLSPLSSMRWAAWTT